MTIEELEEWYKNAPAPQMPVHLDEANTVHDYALFVNSHFEGLKFAKVELTKSPLMTRLLKMKLLIEANL
ncbi:DUF6965 family protein [Pedobacter xixiisoli]|uniref:DUF6965 domain-containing protein n=1 Tax=Pedobacter xixiisoli TaxID=1476464 RepID=A0A285ZSM1_9SPHI|nr:hypothetical protein [Pedobacter xixiisoli]SOD12638.1 hypothetical protein SAMN06297358_0771 [Pedobacter xixiisoli]